MSTMNEEELRKSIEHIILTWSSEMTGEQRDKLHPETDQLVLRHIDLINQQVLSVLAEVKQVHYNEPKWVGMTQRVVPLSAIEEIERRYTS